MRAPIPPSSNVPARLPSARTATSRPTGGPWSERQPEPADARKIHSPEKLVGDRMRVVEIQIQLEDVHARLAEHSELASAGVRRHQRAAPRFAHLPLAAPRAAPETPPRPERCPDRGRSRSRHQVHRNGRGGILRLQVFTAPLTRSTASCWWAQVRAAARGRVIAIAGSRRGGTRMKIAGPGECLPDDARSDDLAVLLDQLAIGLARETAVGPGRSPPGDRSVRT